MTRSGPRDGYRQIEKAPCDIGIVLVQTVNVFPHDEMFPCLDPVQSWYRAFVGLTDAWNAIDTIAYEINRKMQPALMTIAKGRRGKTRGAVAVAQSVCYVQEVGCPVPIFNCQGIEDGRGDPRDVTAFAAAFSDAISHRFGQG
jgi:hypothetical protein